MYLRHIEMQILEFGILLLAAYLGGKVTQKLNIGEIVGQILGGILVSPHTLQLLYQIFLRYQTLYSEPAAISTYHIRVTQFQEYGYILEGYLFFIFLFLGIIAFSVGEEFHRDRLRHLGRDVIQISLFQSFLTFTLLFLGFWIGFKFPPLHASLIGAIGIASAPVLTFALVRKFQIEGTLKTMLANMIEIADILEVLVFAALLAIAVAVQHDDQLSAFALSKKIAQELFWAILLGVAMFLILKFSLKKQLPRNDQHDDDSTFFSIILSDHPTPSVEILALIMGVLAVGIGIGIHYHLPFMISAVLAGILISNFHSHALFDSLKIENITALFNLFFFALIGSMIRVQSFRGEILLFIVGFIILRASGKLLGTWAACLFTRQDPKLTACLPKLMLPQAGMAAVETILAATLLQKSGGAQIFNTIIPALVMFELGGAWLSEKTLRKWREWTVGEQEALANPDQGEHELSLTNLLGDRVCDIMAATRDRVIQELANFCVEKGIVSTAGTVATLIMEREQLGSTGVGNGLALPHCRTEDVTRPLVVCGILKQPVAWGAPDLHPVELILLILNPDHDPEQHLRVLRTISIALHKHPEFKREVIEAFRQGTVMEYMTRLESVQ